MKKVNIDVDKLNKFDVSTVLFYEDVWDDVFGADQWTEDLGEAVGFIDHHAVRSIISENAIIFFPFFSQYEQSDDRLFTTAKNILRGIDFCLARVLREQTEPDSLSVLEKEETQTFEYEEGHVYVSIFIDYDNRSVAAYFHTT